MCVLRYHYFFEIQRKPMCTIKIELIKKYIFWFYINKFLAKNIFILTFLCSTFYVWYFLIEICFIHKENFFGHIFVINFFWIKIFLIFNWKNNQKFFDWKHFLDEKKILWKIFFFFFLNIFRKKFFLIKNLDLC